MIRSTIRSAVRSAIRGTVRSDVILPEWTPIFEALTTFASYYSNFTPSGSNSTLEIALYKQGSKIQTIAFGDTSAFSIQLDASDVLTFNLISNVELNGVPATSGVTTMPDGYYILTGDLDSSSDIKYYAANATPANFFGIQIHSMKNLDNYDTGRTEYPVNGRDVVELDGLTQYGEIPAVNANTFTVTFQRVFYTFGIARLVMFGDNAGGVYIRENSGSNNFSVFPDNTTIDVDGKGNTFTSDMLGRVVTITITCNATPGVIGNVIKLGGDTVFGDGFYANLRINGNNINRYYPLDRADIIQDVNGGGSTDGNWINAPTEVYRPNNSIDINTVKRSKDAPLASDNLLINSLGSVGEELVVNGDFEDGDNGWVRYGEAQITNGLGRIYSTDGSFSGVGQTVLPVGSVIIEFDVLSDDVGQGVKIDDNISPTILAAGVGHYKYVVESTGGLLRLARQAGVTDVTVDNISVRETTRNVGELANLTGYELVNRGE